MCVVSVITFLLSQLNLLQVVSLCLLFCRDISCLIYTFFLDEQRNKDNRAICNTRKAYIFTSIYTVIKSYIRICLRLLKSFLAMVV